MLLKPLWHITFLLLLPYFHASGQNLAGGFTNKAEAKNLLTEDSVQKGKWVQYFTDTNFEIETEDTNAPYYMLAIYKDGIPCGKARGYFKSGKLFIEIPYDTTGLLAGMAKKYYESGELRETAPYANGKKTGMEKEYYKSGKLFRETPYNLNKVDGTEKVYYEDGTLMSEAPFKHNLEDGEEKGYYKNGKLRYEATYVKDSLNGISKEYYENGILRLVISYVNDSVISEKDYSIKGSMIEIPDFVKRYDSWWLKNSKDNLRFMQADTLKLVQYGDMQQNEISFDVDSMWFTITTDNRIDSNSLDAKGNKIPTIITGNLWDEGQWNFSKKDNLLTFYLSDKHKLCYYVSILDYDKVYLIRKKTAPK